ncbi:hypothetical protein Aperf_G00000093623 [Anoplocephala perfoliata]
MVEGFNSPMLDGSDKYADLIVPATRTIKNKQFFYVGSENGTSLIVRVSMGTQTQSATPDTVTLTAVTDNLVSEGTAARAIPFKAAATAPFPNTRCAAGLPTKDFNALTRTLLEAVICPLCLCFRQWLKFRTPTILGCHSCY